MDGIQQLGIKDLLALHFYSIFFVYAMNMTRILNLIVQKVIFVAVNFKICLWKSEHFPRTKMDSTKPTQQTPSSEVRLQVATCDCEITRIPPAIW